MYHRVLHVDLVCSFAASKVLQLFVGFNHDIGQKIGRNVLLIGAVFDRAVINGVGLDANQLVVGPNGPCQSGLRHTVHGFDGVGDRVVAVRNNDLGPCNIACTASVLGDFINVADARCDVVFVLKVAKT